MPPLVCRFIPFAAVVAANGINIPLVRQRELKYGIPVMDKDDNKVGTSKVSLVVPLSFVEMVVLRLHGD